MKYNYFSGLSFWVLFAIVAVAILINGAAALLEDEMPGGFNNPIKYRKKE